MAPFSGISISGAQIQRASPGKSGDVISLTIQEISEIAVRIVRQTKASFAVEFANADRVRDPLMRRIYCRDEASSLVRVSGQRVSMFFWFNGSFSGISYKSALQVISPR